MKAFVLAAGIGTRLRPLTSNIPKPMIPILGKPALYYTFANLWKHGFTDACVNTYYMSDVITDYFKRNKTDINLEFSKEKALLGTAGSIKKREDSFDDTFVVMSGDGLSDVNLKKVLEFHKRKKSLATIVLKKVSSRFEYGIAITNKSDQIKKFIEKPFWSDVFNDDVNTGIYVFEPEIFNYIPKDTFFDFSMDLFPLLMKKDKKIYGYLMDEYWTDIGNIFEYKKGVFDILDGKLNLDFDLTNNGGKYISKTAKISRSAKINRPCFIGNNVAIGENSVIKPYSVISNNVRIKDNAVIERTIIWENSKVGARAYIINSIISSNASIPAGISLFDSIMMESSNR
ncbi:MAG: NDP-sugar synthase [Endomicrobium sp.]|jgi:mannose-1-phosphate guanylyltransferase/phosphomannomutase|nr:NDP-sugar synthase [Endomicrobium sp.]